MTTPEGRHDLIIERLNEIAAEQVAIRTEQVAMRTEFHRFVVDMERRMATEKVQHEHRLTHLESKATVRGALGGVLTSALAALAAAVVYLLKIGR